MTESRSIYYQYNNDKNIACNKIRKPRQNNNYIEIRDFVEVGLSLVQIIDSLHISGP